MDSEQVEYMVNRFLGWKLPEDFNPDGGITYDPPKQKHQSRQPVGTNLLTATQAKAMVRYITESLPELKAVLHKETTND